MKFPIRQQIKSIKRAFFQLNTGDFNNLLCPKRLNDLNELSGSYRDKVFSTLITSLTTNDLLLADRYYCTYAVLASLQSKGVAFVSMNHAQKKANDKTGVTLGAKDHLIEWKKPTVN